MKKTSIPLLSAAVFIAAVTAAVPAWADSAFIDPYGLSLWDQFWNWITGATEADAGNTLDPWGRT